uniref:Thioredoxin domain-containing protein n=1 Tax=Arion vulgaris TaxID=1028688 RepID=A0A0B7B0Z0_9EUPU
MKTHKILCNVWLILCTVSLGGADIPHSVPVLEESCVEGICESSYTLTEELSDRYIQEQQNNEVPENSDQDLTSDNTKTDTFIPSSCTSCEDSSEHYPSSDHTEELYKKEIFTDKHSDRSEISEGFLEKEANEKAESTSENVDETNNLPLNEIDENNDEETVLPELEVVGFDKINVNKNSNEDALQKENSEHQIDSPPPKRRYFPLLYTIRTLLNSLLSEFGDDGGNQEVPFNSSDTTYANVTTSEDQMKDLNTTSNGTDTIRKTRFQCAVKNITDNSTGEVKIVNSTELLEILNVSKNQKVSPCVLVMFYAPWCHFCARAAPHYNALARAFPQLDVLAVDTSHFSYLNARFGTVAVPNVMLFHARSAVRFNHTYRALENFVNFVTNNTGLEPNKTVILEPEDYVGPLPSVVVQGRDWLLWLAWTFVIVCTACGFVRSQYGQSLIMWLRVLWQEHQHIE